MSPRRTTERDVPETDDRDGRHRRMSLRRKAETDGPLISLVRCVWVERCVSLVDDSGGVCGCGWVFGGCAWGRVVEEGMAETARFVVV